MSRKPDICFRKSGRIDITSSVSTMMDMRPGDVIDIMFDPESRELYLYIKLRFDVNMEHTRFENSVKRTKGDCRFYRVQSKTMCDSIKVLTNTEEAWLYVGRQKIISINGRNFVAVPLIWRNNRYGKQ